MIPAKLVTLGLLKTKVTWNKDYNVMIFVHDVTSETFSRYSNYIVDVAIWAKFDNSSVFMTEVIITSIL